MPTITNKPYENAKINNNHINNKLSKSINNNGSQILYKSDRDCRKRHYSVSSLSNGVNDERKGNHESIIYDRNNNESNLSFNIGWSKNEEMNNCMLIEKENISFESRPKVVHQFESQLNDTQQSLNYITKQYEDLVKIQEIAQIKLINSNQETDRIKTDAEIIRKQFENCTIEQGNKTKWIEKCELLENELNDLRRAKQKAIRKNNEYEEQLKQYQHKLNLKQIQIQTLMNDLDLSNSLVNELDNQLKLIKSKTQKTEENYENLSRDLEIMKQSKEKAEQLTKEADKSRSEAENRMYELDKNYEEDRNRYFRELKHLTNQLEMERLRSDELFDKVENSRIYQEEYLKKMEEEHQRKTETILAESFKEYEERLTLAEELIEQQKLKISDEQNLISKLKNEKQRLIEANQKLIEEKNDKLEQINVLEHLLTVKDQDITMAQHESRLCSDKLKQIRMEINHLIKKGQFTKRKYQNKFRRTIEHTQTIKFRLNKRLIHLRFDRKMLCKQLKQQNEQMMRLNNLFWETGWAYIQTENYFKNIKQEFVDQQTQTCINLECSLKTNYFSSNYHLQQGNKSEHINFISLAVQTDPSCLGVATKDWTLILWTIKGISKDLDKLLEFLEACVEDPKTNLATHEHAEILEKLIFLKSTNQFTLSSCYLNFKSKIIWLRKRCKILLDQQTEINKISEIKSNGDTEQDEELIVNDLSKWKLILSQLETDALEMELSRVGQLAQTTANQLKSSHMRLEETLNSIRHDLKKLKEECQ